MRSRGGMSKNVRESLELVAVRSDMMRSVPPEKSEEAQDIISNLQTQLEKLQFAIERKDIDRTSSTVASSLSLVARLEIVQALTPLSSHICSFLHPVIVLENLHAMLCL